MARVHARREGAGTAEGLPRTTPSTTSSPLGSSRWSGGGAGGLVDYFKQVQPILEANCCSGCHSAARRRAGCGSINAPPRSRAEERRPGGRPRQAGASRAARPREVHRQRRDAAEGRQAHRRADRGPGKWIKERTLARPPRRPHHLTPLADDLTFLRRVTLDTVGVVPTPEEIRRSSRTRRPTSARRRSTGFSPDRGGRTTGWATGRTCWPRTRTS